MTQTKNQNITISLKKEEEPDVKTMLSKSRRVRHPSKEQITQLIGFIVGDKMSVAAASRKVNMSDSTGHKYYKLYLKDPEKNIPTPIAKVPTSFKTFTQEQIRTLIHYIVKDKMSIKVASKKIGMTAFTANKYYLKYLNHPNHEIPAPGVYRHFGNRFPQDEIKKLISYIVDDKLSIFNASLKTNMSQNTARKYYSQYLKQLKN